MKFLTSKGTVKKVIIAILLVMIINFISPTTVHADFGGDLFKPIAQFIRAVADLVIEGLQGYFTGNFKISTEYDATDVVYNPTNPVFIGSDFKKNMYNIKYSPGIIFSNRIAAFDVNFFKPMENQIETEKKKENIKNENKEGIKKEELNKLEEEFLKGKGFNKDKAEYSTGKNTDWVTIDETWKWEYDGKIYYYNTKRVKYEDGTVDIEMSLDEEKEVIISQKVSSANILQDTIATWYKALRAIALVGLLSILVYVGIRILISSAGQEKAKYKKMIMDWLVAICILFVLQYIMIFILEITDKVTEILSVSIVGENGEDVLMSYHRNEIGDNNGAEDFKNIFAELLIYVVLVIFTAVFTVQYLKRLLYMAFFTMIAPLIALTYPLDKIKDGKAQAFSMWIREYTFNALLQPMHLLLYYIFISSATSLVDENPIYAVAAIGFMIPAEKFFRKMFGFEQASSASPLEAATGGALIMNAINKIGHKIGKQAAGGKGGSEGAESSGENQAPRFVSSPKGSKSEANGSSLGDGSGNGSGGTRSALGQTIEDAKYGTKSKINGAKTLLGHYFNKANGRKLAKGAGRWTRKAIVGAAGAATLGTVGLAAGIATGDASKAFSYGAAGATAGYMGANALGDKATAFEKKNREIFKEGALGTEEYNTRNSIKELNNDNDFNSTYKSLENVPNKEELIRQFHSNGITSTADIKKSVNIMSKTGASMEEIIAVQKINQQAKKYGMKRKDIEESLAQKGVTETKLKKAMELMDQL